MHLLPVSDHNLHLTSMIASLTALWLPSAPITKRAFTSTCCEPTYNQQVFKKSWALPHNTLNALLACIAQQAKGCTDPGMLWPCNVKQV
jgi:hypothetical protein